MSRVRVLIADDRPIFRAGVQGMLRDFPEIDIVGEAVTGRQAVEHTRRLKPDVVLMDLNMPEMGGIAATRAIKEEDPERVVLALTVSEAEEDIVEMVAAGASGYVLKDVDPVSLARSIQDAHAGRFQLDESLTRRVIMRLGATLKRPRRTADRERYRDPTDGCGGQGEQSHRQPVGPERGDHQVAPAQYLSEAPGA